MREPATQDELIKLAKNVPEEGLNVVQEILIGKFVLWLQSFQFSVSRFLPIGNSL